MKKHLYNAKLSKVGWFIRRFGVMEIFKKPARMILAPVIIPRLRSKEFEFQGEKLNLFYHAYNMTWACERCVEVPIGRRMVERARAGKVLEVGNVLGHYGPVHHTVLDKFERSEGVINEDILDFSPSDRFDLILSLSTFEHIGFDDDSEGGSGAKIQAAIQACLRLLTPGGTLVLTLPIGYNPELDQMIAADDLGAQKATYLRRVGTLDWEKCSKSAALASPYKSKYPYANAIMVAELRH